MIVSALLLFFYFVPKKRYYYLLLLIPLALFSGLGGISSRLLNSIKFYKKTRNKFRVKMIDVQNDRQRIVIRRYKTKKKKLQVNKIRLQYYVDRADKGVKRPFYYKMFIRNVSGAKQRIKTMAFDNNYIAEVIIYRNHGPREDYLLYYNKKEQKGGLLLSRTERKIKWRKVIKTIKKGKAKQLRASFMHPRREMIYRNNFYLMGKSPWYGLGFHRYRCSSINSFLSPYATYYHYYQYRGDWHAHNNVMHLAVELGFPIAVIYVVLTLFVLIYGSVRLRGSSTVTWAERREKDLLFLIYAVFVLITIHGLPDMTVFNGLGGVILWGAAGAISSPEANRIINEMGDDSGAGGD